MITVRSYGDEDRTVEVHDPSEIARLCVPDGRLLWVDAVDPSDEDLRCLEEQFGIHELAMEDIRKHQQRAKLEQYPNHSFLVAKSAQLQEVDLFWGEGWVLSIREHDPATGGAWPVDAARSRFEGARRATGHAPGFLLYVLLDAIVDGYFEALDVSEDRLEALEDEIFAETPASEALVQERLYQVRRDLLLFRRAVNPLRDVVGALMRDPSYGIDETTRIHLQDVYDHLLRAVELLDLQRELMGNAVDAHLAIMSNRMNLVMKRMTSWGAILLGATLVAGIYGMNFDHMPELGWRLGYAWAIGLMLAITGLGWWYFRRKDWL